MLLIIHAVNIQQTTHTTVPPPPPTNIRLTVVSDNSIFVTWDPPAPVANLEGRPLTYNVYTSLDDGPRFLVEGGITATNFIIMSKSYC